MNNKSPRIQGITIKAILISFAFIVLSPAFLLLSMTPWRYSVSRIQTSISLLGSHSGMLSKDDTEKLILANFNEGDNDIHNQITLKSKRS